MGQYNKALHEKYEFRDIRRDEIEQAVRIEAICFSLCSGVAILGTK